MAERYAEVMVDLTLRVQRFVLHISKNIKKNSYYPVLSLSSRIIIILPIIKKYATNRKAEETAIYRRRRSRNYFLSFLDF